MAGETKTKANKYPPALIIVLGLAGLALILFVVVLHSLPADLKSGEDKDNLLDNQVVKLRSYTFNETQELDLCGKSIFKLGADQLLQTTIDGQELAEENLIFNQIAWSKSADRLIVGDRRGPGKSAYLFNQDGFVWASQLDGNFARAVDGGQYIALIDQPESGYPMLHLIDAKNGLRKYTLSFAESGYVVDLNFTPDGGAIDVLLTNVDSSKLKTMIKRYDFNGGQMAQYLPTEAQEFYHGLTHQAGKPVIYSVSSILAVSTSQGQADWSHRFAEIIDVESYGDKVYIICRQDVASKLELLSIDLEGQISKLQEFPAEVQLTARFGQRYIVTSGRKLFVFDLKSASLKQTAKLADEALAVSYDGSRSLYILTPTAVSELVIY